MHHLVSQFFILSVSQPVSLGLLSCTQLSPWSQSKQKYAPLRIAIFHFVYLAAGVTWITSVIPANPLESDRSKTSSLRSVLLLWNMTKPVAVTVVSEVAELAEATDGKGLLA